MKLPFVTADDRQMTGKWSRWVVTFNRAAMFRLPVVRLFTVDSLDRIISSARNAACLSGTGEVSEYVFRGNGSRDDHFLIRIRVEPLSGARRAGSRKGRSCDIV